MTARRKTTCGLRVALACALAPLCACAPASPSVPSGPQGQVRFAPSATISDSASGGLAVCARFALQPYAPAADGEPRPAGSPISFNSSTGADPGSPTDQITGCIEGPNDSAGYNWGYIVTVDSFSACGATPGTLGPPLVNVYPSRTTLDVPVHCQGGADSEAPIHVSLALETPGPGGYVDISAGVDGTGVQLGCKQAEIDPNDGMLHFGESYISNDGSVAQGLIGVDRGAPIQFGGSTGTGDIDTFYTGYIDPGSASTIYQTFLNPCADPSQEYADLNHAQCVSDNSGTPGGTLAELADAFEEMSGRGFAAVRLVDGALLVESALGASGPQVMDAASSAFVPGYNTISTQRLSACGQSGDCGITLSGVFIDQAAPLQFLVAALDSSGAPLYATLAASGGVWALGQFLAPGAEVIRCNGLYATAPGCFTPAAPCGE